MFPAMGEAGAENCTHCGKPRACGHGPACACKAPKAFDPGPDIPKDIRDGLIEIQIVVTKDRNAAGGNALCDDVLKRILDHCDREWPPKANAGWAKFRSDVEAVIPAVLTLVAFIAMGALAGWVLEHSSTGAQACRVIGVCTMPLTPFGALAGLVLGALGLMAWSMASAPPAHLGPARPTERLERLKKAGVITAELCEAGKHADLDPPLIVVQGHGGHSGFGVSQGHGGHGHGGHGHGHGPHGAPPQAPPAASPDAVRRKGAFVLALADQVFESRRRIGEARTGRWTERGYSAACS